MGRFLLALCLLFAVPGFSQVNTSDSLSLVSLYNAANGAKWKKKDNWLQGPVNTWYGVTVSGNRVSKLALPGNNLQGTLPWSVLFLSKLQSLNLRKNTLTGFSGKKPQDSIPGIKYLDISNNSFQGNIPSDFQKLKNLETCLLDHNSFGGLLPGALGALPNIKSFVASYNALEGAVPAAYAAWQKLERFELFNNSIGGNLPGFLFSLPALKTLNLGSNLVEGSLPADFPAQSKLETLNISYNSISGNIPETIGKLQLLKQIYIDGNAFTGPIPPALSSLRPDSLHVNSNLFNFDGMELLVRKNPNALYAPQGPLQANYDGTKLSVTAGGTLANNTYTWYRNNKKAAVVQGDSTYQPTQSGEYYVEVKNRIARDLVLASKTLWVFVSNPDDGLQLQVTPNPARDYIHLSKASGRNTVVHVYNIYGKEVISMKPGACSSITLSVAGLARGTYRVVLSDNGVIAGIAAFEKY